MIDINIVSGIYKIDSKKIQEAIIKTLEENGVTDVWVDVAIVGKEKMDELNKEYYKDEIYEHPIFTFAQNKTDDIVFPPDIKKNYLGQIVLLNDSEDVLVDLAKHGTQHLVGIHHK